MLRVALTTASLSLLVLWSCASPDASLAGDWQGTRPLPKSAGLDPVLAANIAALKLTLKPDGTFSLADGGLPPFTGVWRREGNRVSLEVTAIFGHPLDRQTEAARRAASVYSARVEDDALIVCDADGRDVRMSRAKR